MPVKIRDARGQPLLEPPPARGGYRIPPGDMREIEDALARSRGGDDVLTKAAALYMLKCMGLPCQPTADEESRISRLTRSTREGEALLILLGITARVGISVKRPRDADARLKALFDGISSQTPAAMAQMYLQAREAGLPYVPGRGEAESMRRELAKARASGNGMDLVVLHHSLREAGSPEPFLQDDMALAYKTLDSLRLDDDWMAVTQVHHHLASILKPGGDAGKEPPLPPLRRYRG